MKVKCRECGWRGDDAEMLNGKNPFDDSEIWGCPKCFSIDCCEVVCDEIDCWNVATCGSPTSEGYRQTCGRHEPSIG